MDHGYGLHPAGEHTIEGWVAYEWRNISLSEPLYDDIPLSSRYISAMYYVFNALDTTYENTDTEKAFGIFSFFM